MTFTLLDETGLSRDTSVDLLVIESDPEAIVYEPLNNQYYAPGELILLDSNGTNDADDDITRREWRLYEQGELYPTVISNNAFDSTNLVPGVHHISLYVEDRRGGSDEYHLNITVAPSDPTLSSLEVTPSSVLVDELTLILISVRLDDPDGTTNHVNATLSLNNGAQFWNFNLSDVDGDGIWTGEIEILAGESGTATLKVTAFDNGNIDFRTYNIEFSEEQNDNTSMVYIATGTGVFVLLASVIALLIIRRRKRLADLDLIDSWGVFGGESIEALEDELDEISEIDSENDTEKDPEISETPFQHID